MFYTNIKENSQLFAKKSLKILLLRNYKFVTDAPYCLYIFVTFLIFTQFITNIANQAVDCIFHIHDFLFSINLIIYLLFSKYSSRLSCKIGKRLKLKGIQRYRFTIFHN